MLASFAVESPLTGLRRGRLHARPPTGEETGRCSTSSSPRRARTAIERGAELVPVTVHFGEATTQVFNVGAASCGVPGTAAGWRRRCERFGTMPLGRARRRRRAARPRGRPGQRQQAYILEILEPIHARLAGRRRALRAATGGPLRRGRRRSLPGAGRGARALRRRRPGALLPRRHRGGAERLRRASTAARSAPPIWPATRPIERRPVRAAVPRRRGPHQPAAVLGRDPDRLRARAARAARRASGPSSWSRRWAPPTRARGEEFAEGLYGEELRAPSAARSRSRRSTCGAGDRSARPPTSPCSTATACAPASPAPTAPARACSSPAPGDPQQHARRGGPQPARLPRDRAGPPDAVDDGADGRAARRRDRARARQRRLQPDPLGGLCRRSCARSSRGWAPARRCGRRACTSRQGIVQAEPGIDEEALARIEARGIPVLRRPRSTSSSAASRRSPATRQRRAQRRRRPAPRRRRVAMLPGSALSAMAPATR